MKKVYRLSIALALFYQLTIFSTANAQANISHAYNSTQSVTTGSIVSLDKAHSGFVDLTNTTNQTSLVGVAVNAKQSLIAENAQKGMVQVATSGTVSVLVSDINGNIAVGDQISASPFSGVGMKAEEGDNLIGVAQNSFSSSSPGAASEEVKQSNGSEETVHIGYININIVTGIDGVNSDSLKLSSLQKFAQSLTGRVIPTFRILVSLLIAIVALIVLVTLVYSSIFSSIISIGRNPLAKYAIFRTMRSVLFMALLVAFVAGAVIFLLLG